MLEINPLSVASFLQGGVVTDPDFGSVVLLMDATGEADSAAIVDHSNSAHTLTANNGAAILNEKFEFDGTNDFIETPDNDMWTPWTGHDNHYTWELFGVVVDSWPPTNNEEGMICHYSQDSGRIGWHWNTRQQYSDNAFYWSTSGSGTTHGVGGGGLVLGQSYDFAVVSDGTNVSIYRDGTRQGQVAFSGATAFYNASTTLRIGARADANNEQDFFDGRIAAIRLTKGVARYSGASYSVPSLPLPRLAA